MSEKANKIAIKTRNTILRKQNLMYMIMVISGSIMIATGATSSIPNDLLVTNGIAFIIVGFVGLVMSWTTMDIGSSLKEAIKSANDKTLTKLDKLDGIEKSLTKLDKLDDMAQSLNAIKEILEKK